MASSGVRGRARQDDTGDTGSPRIGDRPALGGSGRRGSGRWPGWGSPQRSCSRGGSRRLGRGRDAGAVDTDGLTVERRGHGRDDPHDAAPRRTRVTTAVPGRASDGWAATGGPVAPGRTGADRPEDSRTDAAGVGGGSAGVPDRAGAEGCAAVPPAVGAKGSIAGQGSCLPGGCRPFWACVGGGLAAVPVRVNRP